MSHVANSTSAANGHSEWPSISSDAAVIAFQSTATNLVAPQTDTNGAYDVFLYTRVGEEGTYTPLTPARILDTRNGNGGLPGTVGPGATVDVQVTGRGGVPASGVSAIAMNVTVTQPTAERATSHCSRPARRDPWPPTSTSRRARPCPTSWS